MWHDKFWFCYSKCCDISGTRGLFWKLSSTNNSTSNSNSKAKERKSIYACLVNTERNNGVTTLGTTTSADRVMTKFTFRIYIYIYIYIYIWYGCKLVIIVVWGLSHKHTLFVWTYLCSPDENEKKKMFSTHVDLFLGLLLPQHLRSLILHCLSMNTHIWYMNFISNCVNPSDKRQRWICKLPLSHLI